MVVRKEKTATPPHTLLNILNLILLFSKYKGSKKDIRMIPSDLPDILVDNSDDSHYCSNTYDNTDDVEYSATRSCRIGYCPI